MMKFKLPLGIIFLLMLAYLQACAPLPVKGDFNEKKIFVGPGPEDIVADTFGGRNRLIVSCSERRKGAGNLSDLWAVDLSNDSTYILKRTGEPTDNFKFKPHGIEILNVINKTFLMVVNHNVIDGYERQSLLVYQWNKDHFYWLQELFYDGTGVYYRYRYPIKEGAVHDIYLDTIQTGKDLAFTHANDVHRGPDGRLWWTNDMSKSGKYIENLFALKSGWVGSFQFPNEIKKSTQKFAYPNGLITVGNDLWISTSRQHKIFKLKDGDLTSKAEVVAKIHGGDNFSHFGDEVLVTSHPRPLKFVAHSKNSDMKSPSVVYAINKLTKEKRVVYSDDGKQISAASTALQIGNNLYIAQVFDGFIVKVTNK